MPHIRTRHGRHRAVDKVDSLQRELAAARLLIDGINAQLADANEARDKANERANTLAEAEARAARLAEEAETLRAELAGLRSELANHRAIDAPAGHRDVDDDDQPTHPIDARPLWAALAVPHD